MSADPARSGEAGSFGDIGTPAANLVEFITVWRDLIASPEEVYTQGHSYIGECWDAA